MLKLFDNQESNHFFEQWEKHLPIKYRKEERAHVVRFYATVYFLTHSLRDGKQVRILQLTACKRRTAARGDDERRRRRSATVRRAGIGEESAREQGTLAVLPNDRAHLP